MRAARGEAERERGLLTKPSGGVWGRWQSRRASLATEQAAGWVGPTQVAALEGRPAQQRLLVAVAA